MVRLISRNNSWKFIFPFPGHLPATERESQTRELGESINDDINQGIAAQERGKGIKGVINQQQALA